MSIVGVGVSSLGVCQCFCHRPTGTAVLPCNCNCNKIGTTFTFPMSLPKEIIDRIEKLEQETVSTNVTSTLNRKLDMHYASLASAIDEMRQDIRVLEETTKSTDKRPHKCPVCDGKTKLTLSSLSDGRPLVVQDCAACDKGIVWG